MYFQTGRVSDRGGRSRNQDSCGFLMLEDGACWVVADGLGGHLGGEIASAIAVEAILDSFRRNRALSPQALESHISAAHNAILEKQRQEPHLSNCRTTAVLLVSDYRSALWAHTGDSRLYHLRGGRIHFQTKDHSVPQVMADAGEIALDRIRHHEDRNRLLRALGTEGEARPTVQIEKQRLCREDAFLLCVDGFWEYVFETEMEVDYSKAVDPADWLAKMESRITRRADENHDNYTAIGVFYANEADRAY
ncbi:MAG: protein phosphatase 2C domain-containing protein [Blastocatellia bacterium]|nr:protein phosphatase 2C domain-containing protein [Blastocatellia bacterium]